jgi:hypothetical protein
MSDYVHIRAVNVGEHQQPRDLCEIHNWPTEGLGLRLIDKMRSSHRQGGVNVCRDCIERARLSVKIVHILHHGVALCGQPGLPSTWPLGQRWVRLEDDGATCRGCIAAAGQRETPR